MSISIKPGGVRQKAQSIVETLKDRGTERREVRPIKEIHIESRMTKRKVDTNQTRLDG